MKAFSLFLVLMSTSLWAQDDFDKKLSELQAKKEEAMFQWRTQNKFNETTLAPFSKLSSYREFYQKLETDHLASEIELHDKACAETKTHCLTPVEKQNRRSALMGKLADLAKRTSTQMENVPQVAARPLVVPEARREVSSEVKPETKPEVLPEVKPSTEEAKPVVSTQTPVLESKPLPSKPVTSTPDVVSVTSPKTTEVTPKAEVPAEVKPETPVQKVKPETAVEARPEVKPETAVEVKPEVRPEAKPEVKPVVSTENEDEKSPKNYKPETCKWVSDLPRRIHTGPGCGGKSRSRMCTGYVVCEQKVGGGKFVRQSTCAADKCGEDDAVACTKDQYYFSTKPSGIEKQFVSPKIKEILSSEQ